MNDLARKIEGQDYFILLFHIDHHPIATLLLLLYVPFCVVHLERLAGLIKSHFLGR